MRFHLIDRVTAYEPWRSIEATKVTAPREEFWDTTSGEPVMPAVLVVESVCQAGSWLVIASTDVRQRAALLSIGEVCADGEVRPGDILSIGVEVVTAGSGTAVVNGVVRVGGRRVLTVSDVMCSLLPVEELDSPEATRRHLTALLRGTAEDRAVA